MNFILVHFKTAYTLPKLIDYYKDLDLYHDLMVKQLVNLYPDCKIHVITNQEKESTEQITYHFFPDDNNYAKLRIFGLLTEPAMYLDNDIILLRKFEERHLPNENWFNLYQQFDVSLPAGFPDFMYKYQHYNSGTIWIPKPDPEITESLLKIKDRFVVHEGGWTADEYPLNFFIHAFKMKMVLFPEVNAYRKSTKIPLNECQSIHYAGIKELFLPELASFKAATTSSNTGFQS